MNITSLLSFTSIFLCFTTVIPVYAQQDAGFPVGPFDVAPTLGIEVIHDDNIFEEDNPTDDTITTVTPGFIMIFDNGISGISIDYQLTAGYYSESDSEDYVDQDVSSVFGWALNEVNRVEFTMGWLDSQDARSSDNASQIGAGGSIDTDIDLDEYENTDYSMRYTIGAEESTLRLVLNAGVSEREYTNNEETTQFNNYERETVGGEFIFKVGPDVDLTFSLSQVETEYDISSSRSNDARANANSEQEIYDIGISWDEEGQLTGRASIGQSKREFDGNDSRDSENERWDIALTWSPLSYTSFSLITSQTQDELSSVQGNQQGDFVEQLSTQLSWGHDWTERVSSNVSYEQREVDYVDDPREDEIDTYALELSYQFNRWLDIDLSYSQSERNTNDIETGNYERAQYGLSLTMTP